MFGERWEGAGPSGLQQRPHVELRIGDGLARLQQEIEGRLVSAVLTPKLESRNHRPRSAVLPPLGGGGQVGIEASGDQDAEIALGLSQPIRLGEGREPLAVETKRMSGSAHGQSTGPALPVETLLER